MCTGMHVMRHNDASVSLWYSPLDLGFYYRKYVISWAVDECDGRTDGMAVAIVASHDVH